MAIEPIDGFLCSAPELADYVRSLLVAGGANAETAQAVAYVVVDASSRGVDTHGVRLVPWYIQMLEGGRINKNAKVTFTRKADAVGHVDSGPWLRASRQSPRHRRGHRAGEEGGCGSGQRRQLDTSRCHRCLCAEGSACGICRRSA